MLDTNKRPTIQFSDEQEQLLEVATSFCLDKFPADRVRARIAAAEDFDKGVWGEMAALGWLGVAVPEEFGGSGLGLAEVVTLVEPMGRALAGTPLVSTTLVAQALLKGGTQAQKNEWLPKICEGAIGALALTEPHGDWDLANLTCKAARQADKLALSGIKTFVTDAASADLTIVSVSLDGKPALVLLDKAALGAAKIEREIVIDETRRSYRLKLDGITVPASALLDPSKAGATLAHLEQAACLLLSAEACGGASGVIDVTVEYLKSRKQFEKYIGSYQALKHPTVDALLAMEAVRSHLYFAATVIGEGEDGEIAVRMAKAQSSDALAFASDRAIQFHGGFGFTYDCDAQLYRRRGIWCEAQFGDAAHHRRILADMLL
ncbi:acyl-CoA dehydrogenase family protein [Parvibaculum sp.]|uniref:acyl-CoA dehydrogenase family protein n=1 Tax=Parvibaculum sp. TaxID=2024848 RepID=UPI0032117B85